MRKYLLASLVGHVAFTLVGSLLSIQLLKPPPAFTTMRVDLQSMTLPEREADQPTLPPEPETPRPEVEETAPPDPVPVPPAEIPVRKPDLVPDEITPEPPQEAALRPPEPGMPRQPAAPKPEPIAQEEVDFPEPETVTPRAEPTPEPPAESKPVSQASPESVGRGAAVQASSTEGVEDYYLALVQRKIGLRWKPTPASSSGRSNVAAVVHFRIGPEGEVIGPSVSTSSGLSVFDRQALGAVIEAAPLPKPPPRFSRSGVEINFRFVYNPEG